MAEVHIPDSLSSLLRPLADLIEYPKNSQTHPQADIDLFCKGLCEYGWTNPVVAWRQNGSLFISAGHLRYAAAKQLGLEAVPVLERSDWTEKQFRAYTIWDNKTTKRAEWDIVTLKDELVDLDDGEFDLTLTGFERNEVYAMVHGKALKPDGQDFTDGVETTNHCPSCGYEWVIQLPFRVTK